MKTIKRLGLIPVALIFCGTVAAASPGVLDTNFDTDGRVLINESTLTSGAKSNNDKVEGRAIIQDRSTLTPNAAGKYKVVGNVANGIAMAGLLPTGGADGSFGNSGMRFFGSIGGGVSTVAGLVRQASAKYMLAGVAVGTGTNGNDILLLRVNSNGTTDTTYNTVGYKLFDIAKSADNAAAIIQQDDGKLVVVGSTIASGRKAFLVMRFSAYGDLDKTFNGTGYLVKAAGDTNKESYATAVVQQDDGKLIVGGVSTRVGGTTTGFTMIRLNANGTMDNSFDDNRAAIDGQVNISAAPTDQNSTLHGLAMQSDGKILATGAAADGSGTSIALVRFTSIGTTDPSFAAAGKFNLSIASSGGALEYGGSVYEEFGGVNGLRKIVVLGTSYSATTYYNHVAVRVTAGGVLDTTFSGNGWLGVDGTGNFGDYGVGGIQANDGSAMVVGTRRYGSTAGNMFFVSKIADADNGEAGAGKAVDGYADSVDQAPADPTSYIDTDGDGIGDGSDNCAAVKNPGQEDSDNDKIGDACEKPGRVNIPDLPYVDTDVDSIPNAIDNCPTNANTNQKDTDGDGFGDVCDNSPTTSCPTQVDADGDLVGDCADNCPAVINYDQADFDFDAAGDLCDNDIDGDGHDNASDAFDYDATEWQDTDGDGVGDVQDNCPIPTITPPSDGKNPDQKDTDNDKIGDVCDIAPTVPAATVDLDGDGVENSIDNCPSVANSNQNDMDFDDIGDVCDPNPSVPDSSRDMDGDGVSNKIDNCSSTANPAQADLDGDAIGDVCDPDKDGDGVDNGLDAFPVNAGESLDTDLDGIGNNADLDDDNDGLSDAVETTQGTDPLNPDTDGDAVNDAVDVFPLNPAESVDTDGDGTGNNADADDDNDGLSDVAEAAKGTNPLKADTDNDGVNDGTDNCAILSNTNQVNTDADTEGDACDTDDDNDGVLDVNDAFPLNAAESVDTDSDGTGNNADTDDDNDGVPDISDAFPLDAAESVDTDNDGIGNNADTDDDNDGVPDVSDAFPLNAGESVDSDHDGVGDNSDNCATVSNADQVNMDADAFGDVCDADMDGDGYNNAQDAFPSNPAEWRDTDSDTVGDNGDNCPLLSNTNQADGDSDNIGDVCDGDPADPNIIGALKGSLINKKIGASVAFIGDVDGDGRDDALVGAPVEDNVVRDGGGAIISTIKKTGSVSVYSPARNMLLYRIDGARSGDLFGFSVAAVADLNDDGVSEFVVGSPGADVMNGTKVAAKDVGKVTVYSGGNGEKLFETYGFTSQVGGRFGYSVAGGGDIDAAVEPTSGKKWPDIIVGAPGSFSPVVVNGKSVPIKKAGMVVVISGFNGSVLMTYPGKAAGDGFGNAVAVVGDVDGDTTADFAVGASKSDAARVDSNGKTIKLKDAGSVSLVRADGVPVVLGEGNAKGAWFGFSLAAAGDINNDAIPDLVVGAPNATLFATKPLKKAGSVTVYSGSAEHATLLTRYGSVANEGLGVSVAGADRVNSDVYGDVVASARIAPAGLAGAGAIHVFSGNPADTDKAPILSKAGTVKGDLIGFAVAGGGDVNNDGFGDVLYGAPGSDIAAKNGGAAMVLSGAGAVTY